MREETVDSDITVIGGGLAGVCAAIAAARLGQRVALVHNRPVPGGNSSSEVRVWVCGATAHGTQRWARESGIMGELYLENQYRNPEGNPYYWDQVVMDALRAEPKVSLFLNTDVREVAATGPATARTITSVTGWTMGSERLISFTGPVFLDCTGDGLVGHLAGADHRIGREGRAEYGESWAPDAPDGELLGSTILFHTKDVGHPVKYVPPSSAKNILDTPIPEHRLIRTGDNGCDYWWIEWGGGLDTVHDNERIRDELWSVIHGIWDHIKNSGKFDAENLTLEWVGSLPGKREYRRFLGDHVLTQTEVMAQEPFEDRVAFGGWSIDLHPVEGMYATEPGAHQIHPDGIYHIPFRSLYSRNVGNLLFAGRNISATHIAFGTTRVMATCATLGEAAGTGAALCVRDGVTPRELAADPRLQQVLLRQDASVVGVRNTDPDDRARSARVSASSTLARLAVEPGPGTERFPLDRDLGIVLPVDPFLDGFELFVDAGADTALDVELWDTVRAENAVPLRRLSTHSVPLAAGHDRWISVPLRWHPDEPRNAVVVVRANADAALHLADERRTGVLSLTRKRPAEAGLDEHIPEEDGEPVTEWIARGLRRRSFCFRAGATAAYAPEKTVGGFQRPYGGPQLWQAAEEGAAWLRLDWDSPVELGSVQLVLDDDVDEYLNNLHLHRTPFEIMPELVRDYRVEALVDGAWQTVAAQRDNRVRHRVHRFTRRTATALRVGVDATNGARHARIVGVRAYG
ncbi:FAD-dependent oxidoreductase [Streptomyces sp. NBC_01237]|uniref:FAD-dependent oxidoreductase n=1 Tax=Streptomyces sp. NBC_01237 TaxID=2903790 RepID=UPI002DD80A50|nr:FAD-dependent oxidoreductase [Streptomyces sp. NBC_01237]WRZ77936.1 FAD-dependent oxidoreductase [Streptomyces sp. NBC_01237]